MRNIVVGIDGSDGATAALRWAVDEARLHQASVTALHAWNLLGQAGPEFDPQFGADDARSLLLGWLVDLGCAEVDAVAVCDLPAAALIEASADGDLLVVGSRGAGGFASLLLGSVSAVVAERALCPVAVVRQPPHPDGPVVVGVDGSSLNRRAVRWAAEEARHRGVPLELLHASARAGRVAEDVFADLDVDGVDVRPREVHGSAAGALVDASARAAVVVVGSRGRGGVASVLLGSTSRHLLHHAVAPVVVVR